MTLGQFMIYAKILGLSGGGGGGGGDASQINYTAAGTGNVQRTVADALNDMRRATSAGALLTEDDTTRLQLVFDQIVGSPGGGMFVPDGHYHISASLELGDPAAEGTNITGMKITGESRGGVVIEQTADDVPIFAFHGQFMHTNVFENMTLTYTNMQTGHNAGNVFSITGDDGGSFYNSVFQNISASNFYNFMDCQVLTWWGNVYRGCWFGDYAHSVNNITGGAGEPRCLMQDLYISAQSATGPIFNHQACTCKYDNVEVNAANSGAVMITDGAGGSHLIDHFALEGAVYAANATLFDVPNSRMQARYIYLQTLTIEDGVTLTAFNTQGGISMIDCDQLDVGFGDDNAGTFLVLNSAGPLQNRFGNIVAPFGANCQLTDTGGSESANFVRVEYWNEQSRMAILDRTVLAVSLTHDSEYIQYLGTSLTSGPGAGAPMVITMPPDDNGTTTQLFTGRRFKFVKTVGEDLPDTTLQVFASDGATQLANLGGSQSVEFVWAREGSTNGGIGGSNWVKVTQVGW